MLRKKSTVIQSERCRVVKVRYFQNGKEPLQSLYSEKFPECTNFESYYLRNNGKFSQQTEQMWTIFNYSYVYWFHKASSKTQMAPHKHNLSNLVQVRGLASALL